MESIVLLYPFPDLVISGLALRCGHIHFVHIDFHFNVLMGFIKFGQKTYRLDVCIIVRTIINRNRHTLYNRQAEGDGLQLLTIRLLLGIYLYFLNKCFHQLTPFLLTHQVIEFIKVNQTLVDVVASDFICLDGFLFSPYLDQHLLLFIYLIIHPVQSVIQIFLLIFLPLFIVSVVRI